MKKSDFISYLLLGTLLIFVFHLLVSFSSVTAFFSSVWSDVIMPVLFGFSIAYVLSLPVSFLEYHLPSFRYRRAVSITLSLFLIAAVIFVILALIIPQLLHSAELLYQSALDLSDRVQSYISSKGDDESFMKYVSDMNKFFTELMSRLSDYLQTSGTSLLSSAAESVSGFISSIISFFVSLMIGLYFVADRERISADISKLAGMFLPHRIRTCLTHLITLADQSFSRFITAQCLESVILGSLCALGMVILRLPYAPMIGSLIAVTALIPIWGALIGGALSFFLIAVVSPVKAIIFLIFFIILQQTEGNLIYPRVVGASVGLPPVYTFLAVTVFGSFSGIVGMLLAVPVSTVIYSLLKEQYAERKSNIAEK
ncbi:MAG: AI-2E family transporter [Bullifex sp.]